jgi:RNA polymerase sigma-70 factor (ECF subfamily)
VGSGDEVVAALARDRGRALVAYAYLLTGDLREAEDLTQDALVKTVVRTRDGADLERAEAYVRRTILTTFVDQGRRRSRWLAALPRLGHESTLPTTDPQDRAVARADVRAALDGLPRRERACVVLRYYDDLPLAEIAAVLDVSTGAVKRYLSDGTRRLAELLDVDVDTTTEHEGSHL